MVTEFICRFEERASGVGLKSRFYSPRPSVPVTQYARHPEDGTGGPMHNDLHRETLERIPELQIGASTSRIDQFPLYSGHSAESNYPDLSGWSV